MKTKKRVKTHAFRKKKELHVLTDARTGERSLLPSRVFEWFNSKTDEELKMTSWDAFCYIQKDKIFLGDVSRLAESKKTDAVQLLKRLVRLAMGARVGKAFLSHHCYSSSRETKRLWTVLLNNPSELGNISLACATLPQKITGGDRGELGALMQELKSSLTCTSQVGGTQTELKSGAPQRWRSQIGAYQSTLKEGRVWRAEETQTGFNRLSASTKADLLKTTVECSVGMAFSLSQWLDHFESQEATCGDRLDSDSVQALTEVLEEQRFTNFLAHGQTALIFIGLIHHLRDEAEYGSRNLNALKRQSSTIEQRKKALRLTLDDFITAMSHLVMKSRRRDEDTTTRQTKGSRDKNKNKNRDTATGRYDRGKGGDRYDQGKGDRHDRHVDKGKGKGKGKGKKEKNPSTTRPHDTTRSPDNDGKPRLDTKAWKASCRFGEEKPGEARMEAFRRAKAALKPETFYDMVSCPHGRHCNNERCSGNHGGRPKATILEVFSENDWK
jgi:hypothetical protein